MSNFISESYSENAKWWLPETPQTTVHGNTSWDSKSARTELNSLFDIHLPSAGLTAKTSFSVLHGLSRSGKKVTLLDSNLTKVHTNFNERLAQHAEMESRCLIIGAHVTDATTYQSARFAIPGLNVWLARPTVTSKFERSENGNRRFLYNTEEPANETVRVSTIDADLIFEIGMNLSHTSWKINVDSVGYVILKPDFPKTLSWYCEQVTRLTMFLSLVAASPMSPNSIQLTLADREEIDVLIEFENSAYCRYSSENDFFMRRDGLSEHFSEIVNHWYSLDEQLSVAAKLATGALSAENLTPSVELLLLLQSLESLHRGMYLGLYMNPDEFKEVANKMIAAIPPESVSLNHRMPLKSRVQFGNQMSLRNRLKELAKGLGDTITPMILGQRKKVLDSWTDTRNYFTHWDQETKENVLAGIELLRANIKINNFLRVLYLDLVGISHSEIVKSLQNGSRTSQDLIRILNREFTDDMRK